MGSGEKRKGNDSPIIRQPLKAMGLGLGKAGGKQVADVCKPSFEVMVKSAPLVKEGVRVYLQKQSKGQAMLIGGTVIGVLTLTQSAMVETCSGWGVLYEGEIIKIKLKFYARFSRFSR